MSNNIKTTVKQTLKEMNEIYRKKTRMIKKEGHLMNKQSKIISKLSTQSKTLIGKYLDEKYKEYHPLLYFDRMIKGLNFDADTTAKIYDEIDNIYIVFAISHMLRHDITTVSIRKIKRKLNELMDTSQSLYKIYNIVESLDLGLI